MRKQTKKGCLLHRILALVLTLVMVGGMLPETTVSWAAPVGGTITTVADPDTVSRPADVYGNDTENAGKITVGKSVSDGPVTLTKGSGTQTFTPGANNFIVTVSQAAQVMGLAHESSVPVDVVLVLDASGSMSGRVQEMVNAANSAIRTLMAANEHNRVSVVAFSGVDGGGTSNRQAANVLSPLAHYSGEGASAHLTYSGGNIYGRGMQGNQRLYRKGTSSGTNIHAGVVVGAQQLMQATNLTVEMDGKQVTRLPFLVVMSDGQPSYAASGADWTNPSLTTQLGTMNNYAGLGFLPAIAAAYYKGAITEKYFGDRAAADKRCFVYTLGLGLTDLSRDQQNLALMTVNPSAQTASNNYFNTFEGYWDGYEDGTKNVRVQISSRDYYNITPESIRNTKNYVYGISSTGKAMGYTGGYKYEDKYFHANQATDLAAEFTKIIVSIQEQAMAAPTHVDAAFGEDFSGYVTFTDPIGEYMEVKNMFGILAGGNLYEGKTFAQYMQNWASAPQSFKDAFTKALKERCRLTNNTSFDVDGFVAAAVASSNQAYYNSDSDYDNSLVWWGHSFQAQGEEDLQMQQLGFADNDTIEYIEAQKAAGTIPEGADYVCRSYFYYGAAGNPENDYLYFMVRVQRSLKAPYQQTVVISAPASLLSMETVMITEITDAKGNTTYTAKVTEAEPARVVYEVGLRSDLNAYNVAGILEQDPGYLAETAEFDQEIIHTNYDAATGTYTFYTNDWNRAEGQHSHHRAMAHATFDAAAHNSFYTYQQDTLVYTRSGNNYVAYTGSAKPVGSGYYYARTVYDWDGQRLNADGTYNATLKTVFIPVTLPDVDGIKQVGGNWYISKGLYKASSLTGGEDLYKSANNTQSSEIVVHPHRTTSEINSHYTVVLGNNGKLSIQAVDTKQVDITKADGTVITDGDGHVVMVGDTLTYTVDVVNGGTTAANAIATDTVPKGTALVDGSITNGGTFDAAAGIITWNLQNIPAGETVQVSFQVTVTEAALSGDMDVVTIDNTAYVTLTNGFAYNTNTTTNPPEGKKVTDTDGKPLQGGVQVPDVLVYRIRYYNDLAGVSTVTVTDIIPTGTTYVEGSASHGGVYDGENRTITWTIDGVQPGASGVVSFRVHVNASAVEYVENNASIKVGNNEPRVTNQTTTDVKTGDLQISKVVRSTGYPSAMNREYTLNIAEVGQGLAGTYAMTRNGQAVQGGITFTKGHATVTIKHGDVLVIENLPAGAVLSVTEAAVKGFIPAYTVNGGTASAQEGRVTITEGTEPVSVRVDNTYEPADVTVQLKGVKKLNVAAGNTVADTTFGFAAYGCDENGANIDASRVVTGEVTVSSANNEAAIAFAPLTFGEPGTYYYLISEIDGSTPGIAYTDDEYLLAITVSDDGNGNLAASATMKSRTNSSAAFGAAAVYDFGTGEGLEFVNSYVPAPTSIVLTGTKTLVGRTLKAGEFSFVVMQGDTVVSTGTNDASGNITFREITYSAPGTYTYTVSEVNGGLKGVTYATNTYTVVVTVTDHNGVLAATPAYPVGTGIAFTNTYTPEGISITLIGTKNLTGRALAEGEFNFVVTENGQTVATGTNDATGSIIFRPIGYTVQSVGTHTYTVSEVKPGLAADPNMYYDGTTFEVTVTVSYDAQTGTLSVSAPVYSAPIVFNNIQNPAAVEVTPVASKTTEGNVPADASFSFTVRDMDGKEVGAGVGPANGNVTFSNLRFTEPGTYSYWIYEAHHAGQTAHGITYDGSRYLMQVVVTRNATNKLEAVPTYYASAVAGSSNASDYTTEVSQPAFHNIYAATGHINITAKKVLTGNRELKVGDFAFKLVREGTGGIIDGVITAVANNEGTVTFSTMYYGSEDLGGQTSAVITYTMTEVEPASGKIPGVTYDHTSHTVYVMLTDNGDGTISAKLVTPDGEGGYTEVNGFDTGVTFTNAYNPISGASETIGALKTLDGRTLNAGEFSFQLHHVTDSGKTLVATATNTANGTVTFPTRNYPASILQGAASMDIIYEISEVNNNLGGITYSGSIYYAKVTITDNGNGTLSSSLNYYADAACTQAIEPTAVVFANTYEAKDTTFTPTAKKEMNRTLLDDLFSFVVKDSRGNVVSTGLSKADGSVQFTPIGITAEGTFKYTISEVVGNLQRVLYTDTFYNLQIDVTDDGSGNLVPTATYTDAQGNPVTEPVVFTNTYVADDVSVTFEANKTLTGRDAVQGEFSFVVKDASGKIVATGGNAAAADGAAAAVTFSTIGFKHSQLTDGYGEFVYSISELPGTEGGITYDAAVYYAKVTVTYDPSTGRLTPKVKYYADAACTSELQSISFTNTYKPADVALVIPADKTLVNKTLEAGEFTFTITGENGYTQTKTNAADGTVTFDALTFDAEGTYTFTVSEAVSAGYDATRYTLDQPFTVIVTVTDNERGQLVATATYHVDYVAGEENVNLGGVEFINHYTAPALTLPLNTEIGATKTVTTPNGITYSPAGFRFAVVDVTGAVIMGTDDQGQTVPMIGVSDANGVITFPQFTFPSAGEYHYWIAEMDSDKGGITEDPSIWEVHILVRYNQDTGLLYVSDADVQTYLRGKAASDQADPVFTNVYNVDPATVYFVAVKALDGRDLREGEFLFYLMEGDMIAAQGRNSADGYVTFKVTYDTIGAHTYSIREYIPENGLGGVTYDDQSYGTVTVDVRDNGQGQLVASVGGTDLPQNGVVGTGVTITNTYYAKPAAAEVRAEKFLTGGKLLEEGAYTFQLVNDNDPQEVYTVKNSITGAIFFDVQFTAPGVYKYTMSEVKGDDLNTTYDSSTYQVIVTVSDDYQGQLHATVEYGTVNGLTPVFTNIYTPSPIAVNLEATKILLGRTLVKDEFTFLIHDEQGAQVASGKNDEKGKVLFDPITYTEAGIHTYTVTEKNLGEKGMIYDDSAFTVTVTVVNDNGVLKATVESETLLFSNTYKPPVTPNTGDETPVMLIATVAVLAAAAFLALVLLRKKIFR